ncbi:MAG TPA: response regulator [Anaerolineales bacterium]|nr:response regulator [Anaerolineales bacterium]
MPKDLNVLLIEDDPYARDLMGMLLARDWRTRVIAETGSEDGVRGLLDDPIQRVDTILLDTEVPGDPDWPFRITEIARTSVSKPDVIFTATAARAETLQRAVAEGHGGYLLKPEIRYSMASAVAVVSKNGLFAVTPSVYTLALQQRILLPERSVVLDGRKSTLNLTPREQEIARLAILFNHPHRELSDELLIRADQVAKHVSNVYSKLGLDEFLAGEIDPETFFQDDLILGRFRAILNRVSSNPTRRKTADMATLAFHLLTVPDIQEI